MVVERCGRYMMCDIDPNFPIRTEKSHDKTQENLSLDRGLKSGPPEYKLGKSTT